MPPTMAKRKQRRRKPAFASAFEKFKQVALDEARLVPWPKVQRFVDESLRWEPFELWIRAVVNAAGEIPPVVEEELERRIPGLLARFRTDLSSQRNKEPGEALWHYVGGWVHTNVLLEPTIEGWPNALIFFASRTLTYMKVWDHWEKMVGQWTTGKPAEWPSYGHWFSDADAVTELTNPRGEPQYVLDAVNSVPPSEWKRMLDAYRTLIIFGMWMELVLDLEGPQSPAVARSLAAGYPRFAFSSPDLPSNEAVHELVDWGIDNVVYPPSEQVMAALTWHIAADPEYYGTRGYAIDCHHRWSSGCPGGPPSFAEWRKEAEQYSGGRRSSEQTQVL